MQPTTVDSYDDSGTPICYEVHDDVWFKWRGNTTTLSIMHQISHHESKAARNWMLVNIFYCFHTDEDSSSTQQATNEPSWIICISVYRLERSSSDEAVINAPFVWWIFQAFPRERLKSGWIVLLHCSVSYVRQLKEKMHGHRYRQRRLM